MELQYLKLALPIRIEMFKDMIDFESQFDEGYDKGRVSALKFVVDVLEGDLDEKKALKTLKPLSGRIAALTKSKLGWCPPASSGEQIHNRLGGSECQD